MIYLDMCLQLYFDYWHIAECYLYLEGVLLLPLIHKANTERRTHHEESLQFLPFEAIRIEFSMLLLIILTDNVIAY